MCIHYLRYLEAVLDQVVVLPAGGSGLGVILQQDKELLGQLVCVLLHCRQRELQQPGEGHQSLGDHLGGRGDGGGRALNESDRLMVIRGSRVNALTLTCMELRQSSSSSMKGSSICRAKGSEDVTLDFFRLRWSS